MKMKPENIDTIGFTISLTFSISYFIHRTFISVIGLQSIESQVLDALLLCFSLFGISLEIAANRISKRIMGKEKKKTIKY